MLHSHDQFGRLRAQKKRNKNTPNTHSHTKETVEDECKIMTETTQLLART